ncbi:DUF4124 domain-containing protein [Dechloromonas sp. HYN0024]|uniref:DUF4124 domain-containing protein n=1 Tax=Dechloromonas sp. HYN0024 TaxID=2231055 RepID=UPI000E444A66|nr:DUF4124 domain-containing protein [Dechloromonas sp. HYN0024]AXS79922.1 DUF4124 domain-containing protein [Dechloromonas sp. HYN0024]
MTSKSPLVFALVLMSSTASLSIQAETYQWKDGSGQTVVSDVPPPSTAKGRRSIGGMKPAVVSEALPDKDKAGETPAPKAAEGPKTTAEKDFDFKKRQQEAKEKADKQAAEADKRDNCERARRSVAALESNHPLSTLDDNGERKLMDSAQREQEMERARRVVADACK